MASLDKLAIRGIRSFDDKQLAVIEFFAPVTVIVGHNGSGKTTIIECLKYATTGEQPPNTRGGAFIHDPKMANEKEVKAQVKLRFYAANGQRMLAVRSLSVSVKKTSGLTMKTLESILALDDPNTDRGGKRAAISTKCAEMDAEIPHLLGVSKAVLENVIFCHQEDSYWPLAEPSILKKKFDEIFEATKYTKALDSIKALRKDRMAELKAEKERLESLSLEKSHADKLKTRISTLKSNIGAKEIEYEEAKEEYERLVAVNQKFYDSATKFRETYTRVETLESTKSRYEADLADAKENLQELQGTDEELALRLSNFDEHIAEQKRKKRTEESRQQDLEEDLITSRRTHVELMTEQGKLQAQLKAQEQLVADRDDLIREIARKHHLKGYDHTPLERGQVTGFTHELTELQRAQNRETDKLQSETKRKAEEYNTKLRQLTSAVERHRQNRENLRGSTVAAQAKINRAEERLDELQGVPTLLQTNQEDRDDRTRRIDTLKEQIKVAKYDENLTDKSAKYRQLEAQKDELSQEMRGLSLQAESRAKLEVTRKRLGDTIKQMNSQLEVNKVKFRELVGTAMQLDTMEKDLDVAQRGRERELAELEASMNTASQDSKAAEAIMSNLTKQLKEAKEQAKKLDRDIAAELADYPEGLENPTVQTALEDATANLSLSKSLLAQLSVSGAVWNTFLDFGQTKQCCPLCDRGMDQQVLSAFERNVQKRLADASNQKRQEQEEEVNGWQDWVDTLQRLSVVAAESDKLKKTVLPSLESQLETQRKRAENLGKEANTASAKVDEARKMQRELGKLKQEVMAASRMRDEIETLQAEVVNLESDLAATGSTKTAEGVQKEIDKLSLELRSTERDKHAITAEKERTRDALRDHQNELNRLQIKESELKGQLREKESLESGITELKEEVVRYASQKKDLESQILEAQAPIKHLELEYQQEEKDWNEKLLVAQQASQSLNMSVDKLEGINKRVERQVKEKLAHHYERCNEKIRGYEADIQKLQLDVEKIRSVVQTYEKEIGDAGAAMANLRENIRVRKLMKDIAAIVAEISTYDMEEAAKAKRIFQEKYTIEKAKETEMQSKYLHIGGELSSAKEQLKTQESDMREFKDINKKYRDQLVKVKLSDMANNDLEKYAKALDNAIMKYHSLKMEEVNETMRHLWNKTYQGTDIDGIKISSDIEGGASKRSYNYRVVMTKDQVGMDMRGRCSAGQKMLASIIIRLALADSFGQNCGILALDEPTNALDTENIDALAESLVDIINERKNQGNFQLIIITHDENFLRKLGQSDVMEHYWRVSRDVRQKSIIERHRFA